MFKENNYLKSLFIVAILLFSSSVVGYSQKTDKNSILLPENQNCFIINPPATQGESAKYLIPVSRVNQFWSSGYEFKRSNMLKKKSKWVAEIIWKDVDVKGGLELISITPAGAKGVGPNQYIEIEVKYDPQERYGNAVIGIKMADGKYNPVGDYLWSWHIWVSDYSGELQDVSGGRGIKLMDRNLGARNSIKGDPGSVGLLYQWGRKDPFIGGTDNYWLGKGKNSLRSSTIVGTWSSKVVPYRDGGTMAYTVENPTSFVKSEVEKGIDNFNGTDWQKDPYGGRMSTLWQNSRKTIFDPCPKGYKVANRYAFSALNNDNFLPYPSEENYLGRVYGEDVWFPMNGFKRSTSGALTGARTYGYVWTSQPSYTTARNGITNMFGRSLYFYKDKMNTDYRIRRAAAAAVRCMRWAEDD